MLKFYGKPKELQEYLKNLCKVYGKNQSIMAIFIIMEKEEEVKNETI